MLGGFRPAQRSVSMETERSLVLAAGGATYALQTG